MTQSQSIAAAWLMAARPATLTAAIAPVVVGTAHAIRDDSAHWGGASAALLGAILIQIGTNFINDVEDFERGADNEKRTGPARAVERGLISPSRMRLGAIACFVGAAIAGLYLVQLAGWPILLIGVLSIISGIAYTAGPWPLAYLGLGDVFVFVFFGPAAVCGTYLVQANTVTTSVFLSGCAVGALATAILAVNNTRDVDNDARANKRTIAVRYGDRATRVEYALLLAMAFAIPPLLAVRLDSYGPLLALLPAVRAVQLTRRVATLDGAKLNPLLRDTALLELVFAALLSIGLCL